VTVPLTTKAVDERAFTDTLPADERWHIIPFTAGFKHAGDGAHQRFAGHRTGVLRILRAQVVDEECVSSLGPVPSERVAIIADGAVPMLGENGRATCEVTGKIR